MLKPFSFSLSFPSLHPILVHDSGLEGCTDFKLLASTIFVGLLGVENVPLNTLISSLFPLSVI